MPIIIIEPSDADDIFTSAESDAEMPSADDAAAERRRRAERAR